MSILYFDIETLPTDDAEIIADMAKTITAPGQYKKQESIDAWMAENKESALKELVAKTSFDGALGRIACISWAIDDGEILATTPDDSESEMLHAFGLVCDAASTHYHGGAAADVRFCGHNIAGFDLPFMKHRSIIHNIRPHSSMMKAISAKPWESCILDTMLMWSADREKRISMDKLCKVLGIKGKDGFDGSMVADTWQTDPMKVIDYCKDDVWRTREIYKRLSFAL